MPSLFSEQPILNAIKHRVRGIFVGLPDDSAGLLFYVPDAKRTFVSRDTIFDEDFTSPLYISDILFTGAIRLRDIKLKHQDQDIITEHTGKAAGDIQTYEKETDFPMPNN